MPVLTNGPSKKKAAASRENGKLGGRPRAAIDLQMVKLLASLMGTIPEIAQVLGCSASTIKRARKTEAFREAMNQGYGHAMLNLRRAQWAAALGGNATMLIFLGKAHLGQSDKGGDSTDDPIDEIKITIRRPKPRED